MLVLTGDDLTLRDVWDFATDGAAKAEVADAAKDRMRVARELVESITDENTYGVNTGFGRFVTARIPDELTEELQHRLLRTAGLGSVSGVRCSCGPTLSRRDIPARAWKRSSSSSNA